MTTAFERGDLIFFRHLSRGSETQSAGIVINVDEGLLTIALPQGIEVWNMRSSLFGSAWRVEHTPRAMTEDEAVTFAVQRIAELRRRPPVLVEPEDDRLFVNEPHVHGPHDDHSHGNHRDSVHVHARGA